ncbi:hypothetical protein RCZ02_16440 [Capnocytophaga felis]|uniref:hypothetical protein n=1 Tax=Capnocytophaga felis TaxID=2267611 RepID=UPI0012D26CD8|nr:hypothetical protein [Capnocytophaga felis]GET48813.1 hypothetical protein RCZ02_16440 [Capnocytophaga felis]
MKAVKKLKKAFLEQNQGIENIEEILSIRQMELFVASKVELSGVSIIPKAHCFEMGASNLLGGNRLDDNEFFVITAITLKSGKCKTNKCLSDVKFTDEFHPRIENGNFRITQNNKILVDAPVSGILNYKQSPMWYYPIDNLILEPKKPIEFSLMCDSSKFECNKNHYLKVFLKGYITHLER